jgi:hypothetical protein
MNCISVSRTKHRHVWTLGINDAKVWITKANARDLQWCVVAVLRTGHPASTDLGGHQLTITETADGYSINLGAEGMDAQILAGPKTDLLELWKILDDLP